MIYNITILEMGKKKETIEGLTVTQMDKIKSVLQRHRIGYESREI